MNTNKLKKFAQQARIRLLDDVTRRFLYWGITDKGITEHRVESTPGGYIFRGDVFNDTTVQKKWENLLNAVNNHTANDVVEEASYIWFNRLIAIKILEENGYDDSQLKYSENGIDPIILQNAKRGNTPKMDDHAQQQLREYLTHSKDEEALSLLLIQYCKNHSLLNRLFGQIDDYSELLLPNNLLAKDGIISLINSDEYITEDDYKEVELIGWLYQFYISDKKDDVFAGFKKKQKARAEDIPAATQIFTPKWIVKYLVENTAGRIWLDKHPESPIRETMKYLVEPSTQNQAPKTQHPEPIINDVTELKLLDPAVGSGHFLVVAFDLLMPMYIEEGYTRRNAVESIITHNLFGLDLCKRAVGLANFAILLKGASYYPDILRKEIKPQVFAMPEQNDFSPSQISEFLGENGKHYAGELSLALAEMQQAQNIGSALVLNVSDNARKFIQKRLNEWQEKQKEGALDLTEQMLMNSLQPFLKPILILTNTYPAVVANPPYMGSKNMNADLSIYLKAHYPKTKSDLFAVFMEVCTNRNPKVGLMGMVNQHSWMFLSSFEKLREDILDNFTITNMLHLGPRLFEELSGEVVQSTAFVLKKEPNAEYKGDYYRLVDYKSSRGKEEQFEQRNHHFNHLSQTNFSKIPGSPIAYWVSERVIEVFSGENIADIANAYSGMSTTDNKRFLRIWYECSYQNISFNNLSFKDIISSRKKWIPYNKGGSYRKWYGNNEILVNYFNDGEELKNWVVNNPSDPKTTHWSRRLFNTGQFFKKGLTWSSISSGKISFRFYDNGFMFDSKGPALIPIEINNIYFILGFVNSNTAMSFLKLLSPTLDFNKGPVGDIPVLFSNAINIDFIVENSISISKTDWDSRETSWDFSTNPLLRMDNGELKIDNSLKDAYNAWEEKVTEDFFKLHENEEELNRIFIDIYGLQDELTPDVELKDITILQEELDRAELKIKNEELIMSKSGLPIKKDVVIKQLLSYAVGCFMGRYRLDKPGLNIAHPNPTQEELSAYTFIANGERSRTIAIDDDAIIPMMGSESPFSDDIVYRVKAFILLVWGEASLTENLNFINECLGEDMEKYLTKKFWDIHKKTYKKKPIYWQFASPKGAFKVITYMHRMNPYTVQIIHDQYLQKHISWLGKQIEALDGSFDKRDMKKVENYRSQKIECEAYQLLLKDASVKQIKFDLDDGVTENYKLFDGVVSKI